MVNATTRSATAGASLAMREGPCLIAPKAVDAFGGELPAPDAALGLAGLTYDRVCPDALGAQQNDLRPPDLLLRRVAILEQTVKPIKVGVTVMETPVRIPQTRTP